MLFVIANRSGSVGIIHLVEGESHIRWLEYNATAGEYTVVLTFSMFTRNTLFRLRNTHKINGVLLVRNVSQPRPDFYSPEDTCPNRYSGYKKCNDASPWNPSGSSLLMEDWPFPMFYTEVGFKYFILFILKSYIFSFIFTYYSISKLSILILILESNTDRSYKILLFDT